MAGKGKASDNTRKLSSTFFKVVCSACPNFIVGPLSGSEAQARKTQHNARHGRNVSYVELI